MSAEAKSNEGPALSIEYVRHGDKGIVTLTVRSDGNPIATDKLDLVKSNKREQFANRLCKDFPGIERAEIDAELLRIAASLTEKPNPSPATDSPSPLAQTPDHVKAEALAMLRDPFLIERIVDDIASLGVAGERKLTATAYLIGTSRLLDKPLAGIFQGLTSSGKSYVIESTARLFPEEAVIRANKMTPEALVHMPQGALVHRWVVAGERSRKQDDDTADATKALREMLSDGRLTKLMPMKGPHGIETAQIDQPGPIAYVESTTIQAILDEDRNRCIVVNTDERPEQTQRIITAMASRKANLVEASGRDAIIERHHAAQRLLKRCRVQIPFAPQLAAAFPTQRTDARRAFGHLLSMIEAVALLHQYQREAEPTDGCTIVATVEDYAVTRHLLAASFARTQAGGVSDAAKRFFERLTKYDLGDTFTTADIAKREKNIGDTQTIRKYVGALADAGFLDQTEAPRGNKAARYKLAAEPPDDSEVAGLPDADEILCGPDSIALRPVDAQEPIPA